jgi:hypothetical protein
MKIVQPNKAGLLAGNEGDIREILTSSEGRLDGVVFEIFFRQKEKVQMLIGNNENREIEV